MRLTDDSFLPADIVVTATGLKLAVAGKIALSRDGVPIDLARHYYYKGCMFSIAQPRGGVRLSQRELDAARGINSDICRVLTKAAPRRRRGGTVLTPQAETAIEEDDIFDFSSGYIQRSKSIMPVSRLSVALNQEYVADRKHAGRSGRRRPARLPAARGERALRG